jgi:nitroreductase/NAD-dependent dihydropyrimidine dehydrogenase PreA subunit
VESERIRIDDQACTRCGLCVKACPARIFVAGQDDAPPAVTRVRRCIVCGHCVAVCPTDAIRHREIEPANCPPLDAQPAIAPAQLLHFMRRRRSERHFRPEPVAHELLEQLLEAGRSAPSASNAQVFQFIVVEQRERVRRLADLALGPFRLALRVLEMPGLGWLVWQLARLAVGDKYDVDDLRNMVKTPADGRDPMLFGAPALILIHAPSHEPFGETDCANAQHQMALMAEALGLGTTTIGFFIIATRFSRALRRELRLPAGDKLCGTLVVGWPRYRWQRIPDRRPARARWE